MTDHEENQTRDWERIHREAKLVDVHTHATLKASFFGWWYDRENRKSPDSLAKRKDYRVFNPFKFRTAFPLLQAGSADVLLTAASVPEGELLPTFLGQRWLVDLIARLPIISGVHRRFIAPPYYEATRSMMKALEASVQEYAAFAASHKRRPVEVVCTVDRLRAISAMGDDAPIALIHAIEGAHCLNGVRAGKSLQDAAAVHRRERETPVAIQEEILANLRSLFEAGVACMTLAHFYPNYVAAPIYPYPEFAVKYIDVLGDSEATLIAYDPTLGLTPFGETVVREMFSLGMLVDVTHSTPAARKRVYELAVETGQGHRVIASHVGVYALNPTPYNLEDWEIAWIAAHGGIVGVIFMNYWLQPHEREMGLNYLSRTIEHIIWAGGERGADTVALGTDFDGFTDPPDEIAHYGHMPRLTQRLLAEYFADGAKYSDETIKKILGGNALRVLLNGWGRRD